jgi:hypothetical protein
MPQFVATRNRLYEELKGLVQQSPQAFEARRRQLIDEAIEGMPAARRQQARQWQFQLEMTLRRYKDPVARMNKMVEILWQQLAHLQRALRSPVALTAERRGRSAGGAVIDLARHRQRH